LDRESPVGMGSGTAPLAPAPRLALLVASGPPVLRLGVGVIKPKIMCALRAAARRGRASLAA
jgi:hypothetical protein